MRRVYYIWGVPVGIERGFHAHYNLKQQCFCVCGSVDFILDDGINRRKICLDNPKKNVFIGNNIWREMKNFSKNSVVLVLASECYNESDYVRDYNEFLKGIQQ